MMIYDQRICNSFHSPPMNSIPYRIPTIWKFSRGMRLQVIIRLVMMVVLFCLEKDRVQDITSMSLERMLGMVIPACVTFQDQVLIPIAKAFSPDMITISAGFDPVEQLLMVLVGVLVLRCMVILFSWEEKRIEPRDICGNIEVLVVSMCMATEESSVVQQQDIQKSKDHEGGTCDINVESRNFEAKNVDLNVDKYFGGPALDYSWKGSFEILDGRIHEEINVGLQAHPPSRGRRKVYEFSKQMPEILQFKMLPRDDVWTSTFQYNCPKEDDIGLYFFTINSYRSSNYNFLLEYIEMNDLVMSGSIDGVELLVFTSKLLPANCQRWNGDYFLWGFFQGKAASELNEEFPFAVPSTDSGQHKDHINGDDANVVDMEIDMIGGEDVGRVDVVIPRPSSGRGRWGEGLWKLGKTGAATVRVGKITPARRE